MQVTNPVTLINFIYFFKKSLWLFCIYWYFYLKKDLHLTSYRYFIVLFDSKIRSFPDIFKKRWFAKSANHRCGEGGIFPLALLRSRRAVALLLPPAARYGGSNPLNSCVEPQKKAPCWVLLFGGERGIWTLATILSYYSLSRGAPSASWVFLRIHVLYFIWRYPPLKNWRRRWDSNPRYLAVSLVFKTSSLNPSDTSPRNLMHTEYIKVIFECQPSHKIILFFCFFALL